MGEGQILPALGAPPVCLLGPFAIAPLFLSLSTSLLPGAIRCSRVILSSPCPHHTISHFSQKPVFPFIGEWCLETTLWLLGVSLLLHCLFFCFLFFSPCIDIYRHHFLPYDPADVRSTPKFQEEAPLESQERNIQCGE